MSTTRPQRPTDPDPATLGGSAPVRPRGGTAGRVVALLAAGLQVVAAFLPWTEEGRLAVDLGLRSLGDGSAQPTVALVLVVLAAIAAVPALIGDAGLPRGVSAALTAALVIVWLAAGPDGALTAGVTVAMASVIGHLGALALGGPAELPARRWSTDAPSWPERGRDAEDAGDAGTRWSARREPTTAGPRGDGDPRLPPPGSRTRRAGFRPLDRATDGIAFEAWSPQRAGCFAAAVRAFVASFSDALFAGTGGGAGEHRVELDPGPAEDLLGDLLDQVIHLLDVRGAVPVGGRLEDRADGGLEGELALASLDDVGRTGRLPSAASDLRVRVEQRDGTWWCEVRVDV